MESSRLLRILVLSILLVNVQGSNLSGWLFPRRCPKIQERCEYQERDECTTDEECPDKTKCCVFSCGKKCLDLLQDVCKMPKETGPCLGLFQRWWYDKKYDTCSTFIYGGCQGNNNNFQSKAVCQNICSRKAMCPRTRVKCLHEERDQCTKNRHCPENMKCCRFGCRKECLDLNKDVCSMPKESGPCMAFMPRWWYDKKTERCYRFIYGGCLGNNNNFQSEAICRIICQGKSDDSQDKHMLY
ncbi:eppin-like isoform X3 [Equus przewalskii]|uniref:Eppin-like isoform X3 n=1 Tax=Equus przewalskii TaxID=9798 RepID=A0ABM4LVN2_EQUPR|nr:eppin [Equus caballus]